MAVQLIRCLQLTLVVYSFCLLAPQCYGLLLDGNSVPGCPINCTCIGWDLKCQSGLTSMPKFNVNALRNVHNIQINWNHFNTIQSNVFRAFQNSHLKTLDLSGNEIVVIETNAFTGIENITSLELKNNRLTTLPKALEKLTNLQSLYIIKNPLVSLDASVMGKIGKTLLTLDFSFGQFSAWPPELRYATHLKNLYVENTRFKNLDESLFQGFENSLEGISFQGNSLKNFSTALCVLSKLTSFTSHGYLNVTQNTIFPTCTSPFIVNYVDLQFNSLTRIPHSLNVFSQIIHLKLHNNLITSVDDNDLAAFTKLGKLILIDNPLRHISDNAFKHNPNLYSLLLHSTQLQTLPTSITLLPHLRFLTLGGTHIECTCANLVNLKSWDVSQINIHAHDGSPRSNATCYNSDETLKDVIMNHLVNC